MERRYSTAYETITEFFKWFNINPVAAFRHSVHLDMLDVIG